MNQFLDRLCVDVLPPLLDAVDTHRRKFQNQAIDGAKQLRGLVVAWKTRFERWAAAVAVAAVALAARALLNPLLGNNDPYVPLFAAVAFSAWYLGPGPAILTTVAGALGTVYWFIDSPDSLRITRPEDAFGVLIFVVISGAVIVFGQRARQTAAKLRQSEQNLENKVQHRTAELLDANEKLQELSRRILQTQDQERRRIARELHDSVGQMLVAMKMNQDAIESAERDPHLSKLVVESQGLLDRAMQEIRTISHLLHPPLLDDIGLRSALELFVKGFAERSQVAVSLEIPRDIGRFPGDVEISIFRIVQECLTNIHKHSGAKRASIRLEPTAGKLVLTVKDDGIGIPDQQSPGIGLRGMRERVEQLGGSFRVESSPAGTTITAAFPS